MFIFTNIISIFFKNKEDHKRLNKVVFPSFIIHFIAGGLTILTILFLTRKLGAREYGIYTYSFTIINLMANLSMSGINIMAVRQPPAFLSTGKTGLWKGFYLWSSRWVLVVSILLPLLSAACILIGTYYFQLPILTSSPYTFPILYALAAVPFYCLMNYYSAWLRGQHKAVLSFLPDNIIKPVFFLLLLICFFQFNIWNAVLVRDISFVAGFVFVMMVFLKTNKMEGITPQYETAIWKSSLKSLFLLTAVGSLNSRLDIIMLGFFRDASRVGIYSGAGRVASTMAIFQIIINQISTASIARLHALNDQKGMQSLIRKISRWVAIISFPLFLLLIFFSKWILSYLGPAFTQGQTALIIMCIGQLISILFGPVGNFLVTTGKEKITLLFALLKMGVIILLNIILTPVWGINGTAIATAVSMIAWNASLFIVVKRKTGVRTWIFG